MGVYINEYRQLEFEYFLDIKYLKYNDIKLTLEEMEYIIRMAKEHLPHELNRRDKWEKWEKEMYEDED